MDDFIKQSSGNVYEDLGYADADSMKFKAELVTRISELMREKNLTQQQLSELTGIPQGRISNLLNGQFRGISEFRLLSCLSMLGNDLEIKIRPTNGRQGKIVFA